MFELKPNDASLNEAINSMQKQIRFASMVAVNRTAGVVKRELQQEMVRVFDRPTPFTIDSIRIIPATKANLQASIGVKDSSLKILEPEIYGGNRHHTNFETSLLSKGRLQGGWFGVPGPNAQLDQYGNQKLGQIAPAEVGLPNRSRRNGARTNRSKYVVMKPGRKKRPGLYVRKGRSINRLLTFVPSVKYRKRFDFFEVSDRVVRREIGAQFSKALQEALATAY